MQADEMELARRMVREARRLKESPTDTEVRVLAAWCWLTGRKKYTGSMVRIVEAVMAE